jgi:hypothetical protein
MEVNWKLLAIRILPVAVSVAIATVHMFWVGGWEFCCP